MCQILTKNPTTRWRSSKLSMLSPNYLLLVVLICIVAFIWNLSLPINNFVSNWLNLLISKLPMHIIARSCTFLLLSNTFSFPTFPKYSALPYVMYVWFSYWYFICNMHGLSGLTFCRPMVYIIFSLILITFVPFSPIERFFNQSFLIFTVMARKSHLPSLCPWLSHCSPKHERSRSLCQPWSRPHGRCPVRSPQGQFPWGTRSWYPICWVAIPSLLKLWVHEKEVTTRPGGQHQWSSGGWTRINFRKHDSHNLS